MLKEKENSIDISMIPFYIIEGKRYISDEKKVAWAKYVKDTIKTGKNHGNEYEETISIMKMLNSDMYSAEQIVDLLKEQDYYVEELYHILKNLLLFHKDGVDIFREYFKEYMSPQLEELISKIELNNKNQEPQKQLVIVK